MSTTSGRGGWVTSSLNKAQVVGSLLSLVLMFLQCQALKMLKKFVPKPVENYTETDHQKFELDAKAFSIVASALPNEIYAGLLHCNSAKELWDALKEQFGGTEEVIENNREILNQQYETFSC